MRKLTRRKLLKNSTIIGVSGMVATGSANAQNNQAEIGNTHSFDYDIRLQNHRREEVNIEISLQQVDYEGESTQESPEVQRRYSLSPGTSANRTEGNTVERDLSLPEGRYQVIANLTDEVRKTANLAATSDGVSNYEAIHVRILPNGGLFCGIAEL